MQDKMFYKDLAFTGAKDFKSGKLGRRDFLYLCALAGVASSSVIAGDAEAAANEIVFWYWMRQLLHWTLNLNHKSSKHSVG